MSTKKDTKKAAEKIQDELKDSVNKVWLAGLGALATAEEEGMKVFKNLVERGESYEARNRERYEEVRTKVEETADKAKNKAGSTWDTVEDKFDETVAATMRRLGVPSRDEIATLTKRVEELTAVVEQLRPAPAKKAAKKTDEAVAN